MSLNDMFIDLAQNKRGWTVLLCHTFVS